MHHRILILNWRDIKNPSSGGAEVLTHEIAKRWVLAGHHVTQFSSEFNGSKKEEFVDGITIIRNGNPDARYFFNSVHFRAFQYYKKHQDQMDIVIDEIHGLPFFTPFYVSKKKIALICEIAGDIWDKNFPFPFNKIGKSIEDNYFRFYKKTPFLTISMSTKKDLIRYGVESKNITVLPMGITVPERLPIVKKEKDITLVFVGRLTKAKGIEDAIEACYLLKSKFPKIKLWVIGRGEKEYEAKIRDKINKLGLTKQVDLLGFVSQEEKFKRIGRAHLLVSTSIKEGYGLTIPEAGIMGTPAVAYNVEGLRDIIRDNKTGVLTDKIPAAIASRISEILGSEASYEKIQRGALEFAKKLSWDKTSEEALKILES
jgi:glycosyltransferase involved in cell wall biosynthesis